MVRMSASKLTVACLYAIGAVTIAIVIIGILSGAGLYFYLLAAAYALTGLFFIGLIYSRVLAPAYRCKAALDHMAHESCQPVSGTSAQSSEIEDIASRLETYCASAEASRMELECLLRSLPVAILDIDRYGKVTFANEAVFALTGRRPSEMIGRPFSTLIAKEDLNYADTLIQKTLSGERISGSELRMVLKDGGVGIVELTAEPMRRDGKVTGCRCVALDMQRTSALEAALQEARARLEKTENDLEQFALIAIRREVKMREIRERLCRHDSSSKP